MVGGGARTGRLCTVLKGVATRSNEIIVTALFARDTVVHFVRISPPSSPFSLKYNFPDKLNIIIIL